MSRNVLEGRHPHMYLDDLESFFFVICWILMVYTGPRKIRDELPDDACLWDDPDSCRMKQGYFGTKGFDVSVDPWFGPCIHKLGQRLFDFFLARPLHGGKYIPPTDSKKDYDIYLGHIQQCVLDMEAEDLAAKHHLSPSNELVHSNLP
jgi:Fungal protein kinase